MSSSSPDSEAQICYQHFNPKDSQLVADLHRISQKSPRLIRSNVYQAPSDPSVVIRSWKMSEFKYYDVPSPFPTLARGLFTRELQGTKQSETEDSGDRDQRPPRYQIVARGYDKFFNIGEVPWTDWSSLGAYTGPRYTLSVKSNGCIIFVAAISSSKLIVTSKHALGEMNGAPESHSQAGHRWLRTHLASKSKAEDQLAAVLWDKNWTAIAELCDDQFEEHVLAYPPEKAGLYLHGINESCKEFHTLPTHVVNAFADEWGFWKTATIEYDTLEQVKAFTDDVAKTGQWKGEPLEGFVVRTSIIDPNPGTTPTSHINLKRPPYPIGSSFFFKVKFDEPYMMYRDWREITKSLLSAKGSLDDAKLPKSKMKRRETQVYLKWVKNEMKTNRSAFDGYLHGKGIIATRVRFLSWYSAQQGKAGLPVLEKPDHADHKEFGKTVIVPIAIPGCGKTSVSIALTHLFKFGHTQSDDVQAKKSAPIFLKNVVNLLQKHDVVIADKNNHLRQHRSELREAVSSFHPPVRLLALNWTLDHHPSGTLVRVCGNRIVDRGDRHQTLRADEVGKSHEDIVWRFIRQREGLEDQEVDDCVEIDACETLEDAVGRAVEGCMGVLGLQRPTREQIEEAVAAAKGYVPAGLGEKGARAEKERREREKKTKTLAPPRYYAILAELDVQSFVATQMKRAAATADLEGDSDVVAVLRTGTKFWDTLVREKRVTDRPHITIVHQAGLPADADLWERCAVLDRMPVQPMFSVCLRRLLWNDRLMALMVEDLDLANEGGGGVECVDADEGQERHEFVSQLPADAREGLHITVGTLNADVRPYEAMGLVNAWRRGERSEIGSLELDGVSIKGRIRGLMS